MASPYILSIDTGTSSCKIGLFDSLGSSVAIVRISTSVIARETESASREYNPEIWWNAVVLGVKKLFRQTGIDPNRIVSIGLTGQIGTHVFLDPHGTQLMPAISWQDGRAAQEAAWLMKNYPNDELDDLIGMHLPPGTAWPIPRLLWLKKHEPWMFDRPFTMLQNKDYIAYRLTGNMCTDLLSLRGLVSPATKVIDPKISHNILHVEDLAQRIPFFFGATETIGIVTPATAELTGLAAGTPVVAGCGDFHAALIGTGVIDDSFAFNITGTSDHVGLLCRQGDTAAYDVRLGKYPAVAEGWDIWYGATSAGGGSVQWFLEQFGDKPQDRSIGEYVKDLLASVPSTQGLVYLPYINGERAPIWDAQARGVFFGFGSGHNKSHFLRAVLEGVAFSMNDCLHIMGEHIQSIPPIKVSGAAAGDAIWNQIKSDIFQIPLYTTKCKESSSLGAAIIAAVGSGLYGTVEEAAGQMTGVEFSYKPDMARKSYYEELFGVYRELYRNLRDQYIQIAKIRRMQ